MTDITTIPTTEPELVEVRETTFLALDGHGAPQGAGFERALATLHEAGAHAGARGPVEGLWWSGSANELDVEDPAGWSWTLLIAVPPDADEPAAPVALRRIAEGRAVQVLHVGPYEAEGPTIERLLRWIAERGLVKNGAHHEIYLDDPRTTPPDRLRTIIRQPVRGA